MTEFTDKTLLEEYESSPQGAQGLAAADLSAQIIRILHEALHASGMEQKELAELIGVTEGRVSQILNGDGNIRAAALARYMRALGYELNIKATPVGEGLPELPRPKRGQKKVLERDEINQADFVWTGHEVVVFVKSTPAPSHNPLHKLRDRLPYRTKFPSVFDEYPDLAGEYHPVEGIRF